VSMATRRLLLIIVSLFKRFANNDFIILFLYVDDMLIVGKDISMINRLKKQLSESFAMKDM